jgi:hypothetical protein
MNRLIRAIDRTLTPQAVLAPPHLISGPTQVPVTSPERPARPQRLADMLRYFALPLVLLVVTHHIIVNVFDLDTVYLWLATALVPFGFGFGFFWISRRGPAPALAFAVALGIVAVGAMTVSQSLNSSDPIMPQTRFEWWDNFNFAATIALGFMTGHTLARVLRAARGRKIRRVGS